MAINKRVTRTIFNTDEETLKTQDLSANSLSFVMTTGDFFYIGFQGKFQSRYFSLSTVNTNTSVVSIDYWDGSAYSSVQDVVDQTNGFTTSGFISWTNQKDWEKHQQTGVTTGDGTEAAGLYWVRMSVSADLSAGTALQSVVNLFSDDADLRIYYPEIVSDTRFLPPGRTDFNEQNLAAKNLVVLRLKQRRVLEDESQIIDVNPVNPASVHAAAMIILSPIESDSDLIDRATDAFNNEINELSKSADLDKDGVADESDHNNPGFTEVVRR